MKTALIALSTAIGLLAGCATEPPEAEVVPMASPGGKFAVLPAAVQRTITAMAGQAEIKDINKAANSDREVYEVLFQNSVANPNLFIAANGTVLNTNIPSLMPTGKEVVMPLAVKNTLQRFAPRGVVANIHTSHRTVYEVTFSDSAIYPKMYIAEDGTVLKNE